MGNADLFLGTIVLMFVMTSVASFAYDSQSGWDTYVNTLPVSKREVVLSKYVLSFLMALTGGLLALLVRGINGLLKNIGSFTENKRYNRTKKAALSAALLSFLVL
jgi:hypothetical protein